MKQPKTNQVARLSGTYARPITTVASGSTQFSVNMGGLTSGSFGTRIGEFVGLYDRIRIKSLTATFMQSEAGTQGWCALVSSGLTAAADPALTTFAQASECTKFWCAFPGQTTPITARFSAGDFQPSGGWFDPDQGEQWQLYFGASTAAVAVAGTLVVRFEYEMEFTAPVPPALYLARLRLLQGESEPAEVTEFAIVPPPAPKVQVVPPKTVVALRRAV